MDSDNREKIIRLEERQVSLSEKVDGLRRDQRWGIITILGLVGQAVFDYFKGAP